MNHVSRIATAWSLAALMGLAAASAASAAPPAPATLIPDGTTGSLTIHKYAQPTSFREDNQGMELPSKSTEGLTPLAGATFQIQQVTGVDLRTNAGWQKAQSIVDGFDPLSPETSIKNSGVALKEGLSEETGTAGTSQFSKLPLGLYLVEETGTPKVPSGSAVTASMPFLITVPLTHPQDLHKWVFDVHAYPKNVISSLSKSVSDSGVFAAGQMISYTIDATIPGGSVTTKYELSDTFDPRLKYLSSQVSIEGKTTTDFKTIVNGETVTVSLGSSARKQAFESLSENAKATVRVTHSAEVLASGEIANDAKLQFAREGEWDTEVESPKVDTKFGGIKLLKQNREGRPLQGASFEVRAAHSTDFASAKPVSINGKSQWVTGADGRVEIDGLRYSAWANGKPADAASGLHNFYWLVEVKAPTGYELLAEPIPFSVSQQVATAESITITNTPHNAGGALPNTGASGVGLWITGGTALMLLGTGSLFLVRRKGLNH